MLGYNITWKLGSTTMPENRYASAAIYSNDANCILIFGGFLIGTTDQKKNVWCYHVENDTFTTYDTLSSGYINQNGGGVFKISNKNNNNEEIYLWNGLDFELIKYNVLYKNSSIVTSNDDYSDTKYGCMVKHPTNDDILYYGAFMDSSTFYSYNLSNNSWTQLASTNENHYRPGCTSITYNNKSQLYIIGGKTTKIEKIDLNNVNLGWTYTNSSLEEINSDTGIDYATARVMNTLTFESCIYIIGGYDATVVPEDDIIVYDIEKDEFDYLGTSLYNEWGATNVFIMIHFIYLVV